MHDSYSEREKVLSQHRGTRNFLEMRADQAVRGEKVSQTKLSEALSELDRRELGKAKC